MGRREKNYNSEMFDLCDYNLTILVASIGLN